MRELRSNARVGDVVNQAPAKAAQGEDTSMWRDPETRGAMVFALDTVLHSYSQVLFAQSRLVGVLVLLATFVVPVVGAVGLLGLVLSSLVCHTLDLDREAVRTGQLGYNALLVFLAIGALLDRGPAFWGLVIVTAFLVVLVHVGMSGALRYHLRLPALSLPFVATTWVVLAAVPHIRGLSWTEHIAALDLGDFPGPPVLDDLLRSLGAIFFQPHWVAGVLVLTALVVWSRIATVYAFIGFAVAVAADRFIFAFPPDFVHMYVGFNFMMTAVAVGGIFYVPSRASLLLAGMSALVCGLGSVALHTWLQPVGMPVLALPFNLTVMLVLYALSQRKVDASPRSVDVLGGSPEETLHHFRTRISRFRTSLPVRLQLPFRGTWVCTQGNDGEHTHQGAWRHGLDFEVVDSQGRRHEGAGDEVTDFHCYGLPVVAVAAGTVVKVIDGVLDNAVGEVNTLANWGNLIIVQHAPELFSMVAHLSPGSLLVAEGTPVVAGQPLAKCGSSGRSPIPHLHVQLQRTAIVGEPTMGIHFHGVIVESDSPEVYNEHLPVELERLRNPVRSATLSQALTFPVGQVFALRVEGPEGVHTETITSEIDLLGNRSLSSDRGDARLWFEDRGDTFFTYDHKGPRDGALFALYCALARVPLDAAPRLQWSDYLNPRRLTGSVSAWLADAASAFFAADDQSVVYTASQRGELVVVSGKAEAAAAWHEAVYSEAWIAPGTGLKRVTAKVGERSLVVTPEAEA